MTHWRRCSVRQTENASSLRMCWVDGHLFVEHTDHLLTEEELPLDELVRTGIAEAQASIQQPEFVSKEEDF